MVVEDIAYFNPENISMLQPIYGGDGRKGQTH
ncbi:MAG: hypothetical protein ACD_72C00160G0001 [uncultured bacterium]|nr:MAG: hypothetical protein ACD_72C00160G0001 [uncultured bacterium]